MLAGYRLVVWVGLLILWHIEVQGFSVTKHQGVFPAKKNMSDSESDLRTRKNVSGQRTLCSLKHFKQGTKFLFFGIFFLFFPEIREKIKERIGKDNKE